MGEPNMDLLEHTVKNQGEDIASLKDDFKTERTKMENKLVEIDKELHDLRTKQTVTDSNINQIFTILSKMEEAVNNLKDSWNRSKDEQLRRYNSGMIKLFFGIVAAMFVFFMGM